jgi:hypothetical protein
MNLYTWCTFRALKPFIKTFGATKAGVSVFQSGRGNSKKIIARFTNQNNLVRHRNLSCLRLSPVLMGWGRLDTGSKPFGLIS